MKHLLKYLPFAALLIIALAAIVYGQKQRQNDVCKRISITINSDSAGNQLLVEEDIMLILNLLHDTVGKRIQDFNLLRIEQQISENPFVYTTQAYFNVFNVLNINVVQREPFVRIMSETGDYYIDTAGYILPLSPHFTPRVLVASGEIAQGYRKNFSIIEQPDNDSVAAEHSILLDIFQLSRTIANDLLLQASIEQIYVHKGNEFLLISKVGPPKIEFGTIENYQQKLQNVTAFYKSEKAQENWNNYQSINVKYKNQVVAIKK